ncbi:MAG: DUF1214 domain-containing protein [Myxococcota bacterium]
MRTASGAEAASHRVDVRRPRRSRSGGARGRAFVVGMALGLIGTGCAGSPAPKDAAGGAAETARAWNRLDLLDHLASIGDGTSEWGDLETARRFAQLQGAIEVLRELVLHDATSEQEASEGLRVVLKVLAMAVDDALRGDLRDPLFRRVDTRWRDVGAFNPDAEYDQAWIDGRYDYRLTGNLGTVPYVSVTVNGDPATASSALVAYLDDATLRSHADAAGDFTVWLTRRRPEAPGAWIELPDAANGVVIRQYVSDRDRERLATFEIHAVGPDLPPAAPMRDEELAARIVGVTRNLVVNASWHRTLMPFALDAPNRFFDRDAAAFGANVANRENLYHMAYFELDPDEALLVDMEPPDSVFWNLTAASFWHETSRFLTDPVSRTNAEVVPGPDGSIRFVVSGRDPGRPNWLDTGGHARGFLILRMVGIASHPLPRVRKLSWEALAEID